MVKLPLSTSPFSLYAMTSGYVQLHEDRRYEVIYYVTGYLRTRNLKGVKYEGYDIVEDRLVFATRRGHRIAVQTERFITCVEIP